MAGAVLIVGAMLTASTLTLGLALTGGAAVTAQRVVGAADNAAVAAADAVAGAVPGVPCELAARVAEASGARLLACDVDGFDALVRVGGVYLGLPVSARARAGPPDRRESHAEPYTD